jgi:hypothetical protein
MMYGNQMNDNVVVSFARALANKNNLKEFFMLGGYGFRQCVPFNGYAAFTRVLGNSSSFSTRTVLPTLL